MRTHVYEHSGAAICCQLKQLSDFGHQIRFGHFPNRIRALNEQFCVTIRVGDKKVSERDSKAVRWMTGSGWETHDLRFARLTVV